MSKEDAYKYHDYLDEYTGIPVYERVKITEPLNKENYYNFLSSQGRDPGQLEFDFDSEKCPAYDK
jgi:hypothetical protein